MKLAVLGTGYVGLVTAAGFADLGHTVACVDIDRERVDRLASGGIPFFEPGLAEIVARAVRGRRLSFTTELTEAHRDSEIFFIAVGTPSLADGRADVSAVHAAARSIAQTASRSSVVVIKSTVPVGTSESVQAIVDSLSPHRLFVASVPEFLKEGSAVADFYRPDRVVVGTPHAEAERAITELYRPLQVASDRMLFVDRRSSELIKYAANSMLAVRISFMNEIARLCDRLGADVHSVRLGIGSDRRIGAQFLHAGPGYGGSCFPKDVSALTNLAREAGSGLEVVEAASRANRKQLEYVIQRISLCLADGLKDAVVAIWGLAFKPETDDVRESPAAPIVRFLIEAGAKVRAHDPEAAGNFKRLIAPEASYFDSEYDAARGADLLLLLTEWRHLRSPDFGRIKSEMRNPVILDARNIWSGLLLRQQGFRYYGIGTRAGRDE